MQSERTVSLSKREKEVLKLIAFGCTTVEAAEKLFVSKRTIDYHLYLAYEKLEVNNRLQAKKRAIRLGLI